ncbi:hypothetical protein GII36_00970 [Candidatus Mycosynbacter amalyticus]|uniref:Type II secretion system protein n=1 Tax=Candidatus Mycosynbacter amalyticus TaxID=2665156 RepID=A0A857MLE7_9BACT|nr:hypothetical protein [Candidatus Mycosynbacter amalyticus]QHN42432.1 hypothetical protein GII36_00970 [Candidatus Mycosynbacter amalyticus]
MLVRQRGDTLIEVLFAVSIFSAIVVGTIIIMNQGISSAQNALEINLVRNQIDTQAELLRHLNNAKLTSLGRNTTAESVEWDKAVANASAEAQPYSGDGGINSFDQCRPDNLPGNAFFLDPTTGRVQTRDRIADVSTFAQIQTGTSGGSALSNMLWVQPVSSRNDTSDAALTLTDYYDFHIRACWDSPGAGGGVMKLGTIVRLYVPRT